MTNKLKLSFLIFNFLLTIFKLKGQNSFINCDSLNDHSFTFLSDKVVIGELHGVTGNYQAYGKIIQALDKRKEYKLVLERGLSFSYLINEYLIGADTLIVNQLNFENEFEKEFYINICDRNKLLPDKDKILTIGIDLEYQHKFAHTLKALEYYLPKTKLALPFQKLNQIYSDDQKSNEIKVQEIFSLIDTSKFGDQKYGGIVKNIFINFYNTIKVNKASYILWGRQREKYLLQNFINHVSNINSFCLIIGVAHLPDNLLYPSFTKKLSRKSIMNIKYFYPIIFNHISNDYIDKKFYCENSFNPLKSDKILYNYFDKKKGYWLLKNKDKNYLVISN